MRVDTRALNQEETLGFISLIKPDGGAKCSMRYWRRTRQVHQTDGLACPEGGADPNNRPQDSFVNHSGPSVEVTLKFDGHEPGGTYYDKSGLAAGRLVDSSDVVQGRIVDNSNLCPC